MAFNLSQITDGLVYDSTGREMLGEIESFEIPSIGQQEVEHQTLGQIAVLQLPGRPLQALSARLTMHHLNKDVERVLLNPGTRHRWQIHKRVDVFGEDGYTSDASHRLVTVLGFQTMMRDPITSQPGEPIMPEYALSVSYLRQFVSNENTDIIHIDVFNQRYEVNGSPVWAA